MVERSAASPPAGRTTELGDVVTGLPPKDPTEVGFGAAGGAAAGFAGLPKEPKDVGATLAAGAGAGAGRGAGAGAGFGAGAGADLGGGGGGGFGAGEGAAEAAPTTKLIAVAAISRVRGEGAGRVKVVMVFLRELRITEQKEASRADETTRSSPPAASRR